MHTTCIQINDQDMVVQLFFLFFFFSNIVYNKYPTWNGFAYIIGGDDVIFP